MPSELAPRKFVYRTYSLDPNHHVSMSDGRFRQCECGRGGARRRHSSSRVGVLEFGTCQRIWTSSVSNGIDHSDR